MKTLNECVLEIQKSDIFLGGPSEFFEDAGRKMLMLLLSEGLMPYSKVLDLGCGCLRGGYWLIRFLDKNCYHGIEPNKAMLEQGLKSLFSLELLTQKAPTFDHNDSFDVSIFDTRFDYFLARSIWTHASKQQIEAMLSSFVNHAKPTAVFLTSFLEAESKNHEYEGEGWVGKSHESSEAGIVKHSFEWVVKVCAQKDLKVTAVENSIFDLNNNQRWLRITKQL